MSAAADFLRLDVGLVDGGAYSPEVYDNELEAVFSRSWLFVGHAQQVPAVGDYVTTWMGETPVVVLRDQDDVVRVFVNRCNRARTPYFAYDAGRAAAIECRSHRQGYDLRGESLRPAPDGDPEFGSCLVAAGAVEDYGGLLFAVLGRPRHSLREALGDAAWYLDNYLLRKDIGGLQLVPGVQRYDMPGNWKLLAENFAGDDYHVAITHASVIGMRRAGVEPRLVNSPMPGAGQAFSVATGYRTGVPHGLLELRVGEEFFEHDLMRAATITPAAVDWVRARRDAVARRLADLPVVPYGFHVGNLFPTMSIVGNATSMEAVGLLVWHPRGPYATSVSELCLVDAGAPQELQEQMCFSLVHQQAAAGIFAPDDHENFERLAENTRTFQARSVPFNYEMGMRQSGTDARPPEWQDPRWPGMVLPRFTEEIHREFYRYWAELMDEKDGHR